MIGSTWDANLIGITCSTAMSLHTILFKKIGLNQSNGCDLIANTYWTCEWEDQCSIPTNALKSKISYGICLQTNECFINKYIIVRFNSKIDGNFEASKDENNFIYIPSKY